jgi:hypothetical protein
MGWQGMERIGRNIYTKKHREFIGIRNVWEEAVGFLA